MNDRLTLKILYPGAFCALFLLAYIIQSLGLLSHDVSIILYNNKVILKGGTYVKDFFETNPPMIFYLYTPAILLQKWIPINLFSIFRIYVLALTFISIIFSIKLLNQIFVDKEDSLNLKIFIFVLCFILLFLPGHEFGQREHFFMILTMPYIFSAVLEAQNKKVPHLFACVIGLMAGLGFGLKPYFLFPIVFIELYFIYKRRSLFGWIRVESVTCLVVLCLYLASVFIHDKEYLHIILPLVSHLYYISIKEPWVTIFLRPSVIYCCIIWICYFFIKPQNQRELTTILTLALTGMMAAFIVPRAAWYYHVLPALGIACLLGWLYSYRIYYLLGNNIASTIKTCAMIVICLYVFMVPLIYSYLNTVTAIVEKNNPDYKSLTSYINSLPQPQRIYCFSGNNTVDCFPMIIETQSQFAGRFPFFWWLRGLIKLEKISNPQLPSIIAKDKNAMIDAIADDLNHYQANTIIINKEMENQIIGRDFDFITYFSTNVKFRSAWQHYRYLKTIGAEQLYVRV